MESAGLNSTEILGAITALATVAGVMATSIAMTFQIKKATEANRIGTSAVQAGIMIKYEEEFHDKKRMLNKRKLAAQFLLEHRNLTVTKSSIEQWDVMSYLLDFFQGVATFTRTGSLDIDTVHKNFFYWISHYYPLCKDYIAYYQKKAPLYLDDLDWLYRECARLDAANNNGAYLNLSDAKYVEFLDWEIEEAVEQLSYID